MKTSFSILVLVLLFSTKFSSGFTQTSGQQLLLVELSSNGTDEEFGITIYWMDKDVEFIKIEFVKGIISEYMQTFSALSKALNNLYEIGWRLKSTIVKPYVSPTGGGSPRNIWDDVYQYYLEKN